MVTKLTSMKGDEFVKKVLEGERDFSRIRVENGYRSHKSSRKLQRYLKSQDLEENPLILEEADLSLVPAYGLYLPFVQAQSVIFSGAELQRANFEGANLEGAVFHGAKLQHASFKYANLRKADLKADMVDVCLFGAVLTDAVFGDAGLEGADLRRANLTRVHFDCADLEGADLREANVYRTNFEDVNFKEANLRKIVNLQYAKNLGSSNFEKTKISEKERRIIERRLFVIR